LLARDICHTDIRINFTSQWAFDTAILSPTPWSALKSHEIWHIESCREEAGLGGRAYRPFVEIEKHFWTVLLKGTLL